MTKEKVKELENMNENIDLTKILKDCPEGTEFWSDNYGKVWFKYINKFNDHPIFVICTNGSTTSYTKEGWCNIDFPASCLLWPSKDCRDWSKFTAPWYKKERFDPKTLKPFDKIIARVEGGIWFCELLSFIEEGRNLIKGFVSYYNYCIPYNDETKHLVGTTEEAPDYYRYWED